MCAAVLRLCSSVVLTLHLLIPDNTLLPPHPPHQTTRHFPHTADATPPIQCWPSRLPSTLSLSILLTHQCAALCLFPAHNNTLPHTNSLNYSFIQNSAQLAELANSVGSILCSHQLCSHNTLCLVSLPFYTHTITLLHLTLLHAPQQRTLNPTVPSWLSRPTVSPPSTASTL